MAAMLADQVLNNPTAQAILRDRTIRPSKAAARLDKEGLQTSERAVRRWREANLDLDVPEALKVPQEPPQVHTEAIAVTPEAQIETLRSANARLARDLGKARASRSELVEAVFTAARDATSSLVLPPVPAPTLPTRGLGGPETAVVVLGDWQLAKVTPAYNSAICETRIEALAAKVISITNIQRADHPVDSVHVQIVGDLVEGELIFPGQSHLIDSSLYRQVCVDGPRILVNFLQVMLANFGTVHVTAVIGNHGRLGGKSSRDYSPESNADRMLYRITQSLLAEERITWDIPDGRGERNWYAIDRIGNYSVMLFHGDQIRGGFGGFPFYGLAKKVWGWKSGAIEEQFDDVMFGHYHQNTEVTLNGTMARCNGSTESYNTYAQEGLAAMGRPSQRLMYVDHLHGNVTAEYKLWLAAGLYD